MLDKLLCIYHSFTVKVSLLHIINTKKLTKTACSSRVGVQYVNLIFLQFYKGYVTGCQIAFDNCLFLMEKFE